MSTGGPRAAGALAPDPQPEAFVSDPGIPLAWYGTLRIWPTPESFVRDMLQQIELQYEAGRHGYLGDFLGPRRLLEDMFAGHPLRRAP